MKKIVSFVLAMLMTLSVFSVTSMSAFASEEYPDKEVTPQTMSTIFSGQVDYPRAKFSTGTFMGKYSTQITPWYDNSESAPLVSGKMDDPDGSKRIIVVEGWGRLPENDSLRSKAPNAEPAKEMLTSVYKYAVIDYYYEADSDTIGTRNLFFNVMPTSKGPQYNALGLSIANASAVTSAALVPNRWAKAVLEFNGGYMYQYHIYPFGNGVTGNKLKYKDRLYLAGITWMTDLPDAATVDATVVNSTKLSSSLSVPLIDFPTVKMAHVASDIENASITVNAETALTPYGSMGAFVSGTIGGSGIDFTLSANGQSKTVNVTTANEWTTVNFGDLSGFGDIASAKLSITGVGSANVYLHDLTFETGERTWAYAFSKPTFASDGSILPLLSDETLTSKDLAAGAVEGDSFASETAFVNGKAVRLEQGSGPIAVGFSRKSPVKGEYQRYVRIEYYARSAGSAAQIIAGDTTFTAAAATQKGWNVANFDIEAITDVVDSFTFKPYGSDVKDADVYLEKVVFSQEPQTAGVAYGEPEFDSKGNYIPELTDCVMTASDLAGGIAGRSGIVSEDEVAFTNSDGMALMITPDEENVSVDVNIIKNGFEQTVNAEWQPYVRVEYFIYGRDTDEFAGTPTLTVGGQTFTSENPLVVGQWGAACFNIGDYGDEFMTFGYKPFGDATGLNTWNKLYLANVTFSRTANTAAPDYMVPDMTDNGILVPYKFTPDDGLPVVYLANGGTYKGDAKGSTDSTKAFGTLANAVTALNAVGGGYIILCTDYTHMGSWSVNSKGNLVLSNLAFPTHTSMIILRGRDDKDKPILRLGEMQQTNGPLTFENLLIADYKASDGSIMPYDSLLVLGKKGVPDDVTFVTGEEYAIDSGTEKGMRNPSVPTITGGNIINNSANLATIRFAPYGTTRTYSEVNITINGGSVTAIAPTWVGSEDTYSTTVNGDVNININGGEIKIASNLLAPGNTGMGKTIIGGDFNFTVTGTPTFTGSNFRPTNLAASRISIAGTRKADLLEYAGDLAALRNKIDTQYWDVLATQCIYVSDDGDDANSGMSASAPVRTMEKAIEKAFYSDGDKSYSGKIFVTGSGLTLDEDAVEPAHATTVFVTSDGSASLKFNGGNYIMNGPTKFAGLNIEMQTDEITGFVANGYPVVFGDNMNVKAFEGNFVSVVGGAPVTYDPETDSYTGDGVVDEVIVEINSGDFQNVITGSDVIGHVTITINGGKIHGKIVGGPSVDGGEVGGNVYIDINDGTISCPVIGGSDASDAAVQGSANVTVNGGTFDANSSIVARNLKASSTVYGAAKVDINGGDFSGMDDGQITEGNNNAGEVTGHSFVNTSDYRGANISGKIGSFDSVTQAPVGRPDFTGLSPIVYVLEEYGDPTLALAKAIPFKINQTTKQSATPVVVSPSQLNLKVDGGDHAVLSVQDLADGTRTIRLIPNHNATKGTQIVLDGWNIKGRGADASYKYAEVVYYYTVPEGETQVGKAMGMNILRDVKATGQKSTELVANQWATALFDFSAAFEGQEGEFVQYHFFPFGAGISGSAIPTDQYMDIISLTFYTDKPTTTISGGVKPAAKTRKEEEQKKQEKKKAALPDILVANSKIKGTVDKSGAFTAAETMLGDVSCVEYTPVRDVDKFFVIEGYNVMGDIIDTNDYQYVSMKIYLKSDRESTTFVPSIQTQRGGAADLADVVASVVYKADAPLVPNTWNDVLICIKPANEEKSKCRQFHIQPIGSGLKPGAFQAGELLYITDFVISTKPPKAATPEGEEGEAVEDESEIIEEAPEIVVEPALMQHSGADALTFRSTVGTFEDKSVVMIKPNASENKPVTIDVAAVFTNKELVPDGALSLKTHRYAIISYYYQTGAESTSRTPRIELLGGRIQNMEGVINGNICKADAALKTNEWATAVIKLTGNGDGYLTSGFNLLPFGDVAASSVGSSDTLYIENVTFVSNRP